MLQNLNGVDVKIGIAICTHTATTTPLFASSGSRDDHLGVLDIGSSSVSPVLGLWHTTI